jgi:serine protease Do
VSVERRLIVTNHHVVGNERHPLVVFPLYDRAGDPVSDIREYRKQGRKIAVRAEVLADDPTRDLALLRVEQVAAKCVALPLAPRPAAPGAAVYSVGGSGADVNLLWRLTKGTVRGRVRREIRIETGVLDCMVLETDAPVNPGDSGGPVVNDRGELVAVVSHGAREQRLVSGNIDAEEVRKFIERSGHNR